MLRLTVFSHDKYYKDDKAAKAGGKPLGSIELRDCTIMDHKVGHKGAAHHPKLDIVTPKKTYTLVFSDTQAGKNDRYTWRTGLQEVKAAHE